MDEKATRLRGVDDLHPGCGGICVSDMYVFHALLTGGKDGDGKDWSERIGLEEVLRCRRRLDSTGELGGRGPGGATVAILRMNDCGIDERTDYRSTSFTLCDT